MNPNLSSAQHLPQTGDRRTINGKEHVFQGWHVSSEESLQIDPEHMHVSGNAGYLPDGSLYTTKDPAYWHDMVGGKYAHEVWSSRESDVQDDGMPESEAGIGQSPDETSGGLVAEEHFVSHDDGTIGARHPVSAAIAASPVRYKKTPTVSVEKSVGREPHPPWVQDDWEIQTSKESHPDLPEGTRLYPESQTMQRLRMGPNVRVSRGWDPVQRRRKYVTPPKPFAS